MKIKIIHIGFLMLISVLMISCDSSCKYEKNKKIEDGVWNMDKLVKFDVDIEDKSVPYNFYINVRNSTDYQFSNVFLFLTTTFPNGKFARDTLECFLADKEGKWLGKGLGKYKDNQILFRPYVLFPLEGTYSFTFQQAMREENLEGIDEVGIRIEYSDTTKINKTVR